jgi:Undecaprenyl-phosphate glucose phosphotransferase
MTEIRPTNDNNRLVPRESVMPMDGSTALQPDLRGDKDGSRERGRLLPFVGRPRLEAGSSVLSPEWFLVLRVLEGLAIIACSLIADAAYHSLLREPSSFANAFWAAGLLAAVLYLCVMHVREAAEPLRSINSPQALRDVLVIWVGSIGAVIFFLFALKSGADISRGATMMFAALGLGGLVAVRGMLPAVIKMLRYRAGGRPEEVIVVGLRGDAALDLLLNELRLSGVGTSGIFRVAGRSGGRAWETELAAIMPEILETTRRAPDGEICIAAGGFAERELNDLITALQVVPRAVRIVPSASIEQYLHFPVRSIGRLLAVEPQRAPQSRIQMLVKRVVDVLVASLALVLLSPLLALTALAIKVDTRGSVFFRQDRLGYRGVPFSIFKFRTMTVAENGAEIRQAQANDSRVTRVGRWLRRLSIDELPQLLNVIRGDMSLVGPRPHAVAHDKHYATLIENYEIRQHVKPGITGWAQVNGLRGETADPELMRRRVVHDIWYAKNASFMLDVRILLLTAVEVFRQRNAH